MAAAAGIGLSAGAKQALTLGATALQAFSAIQQGRQVAQNAAFDAQQLEQQAQRDREISAQEADEFERDESRRRATARALSAGSGVTMEGSPLAVLGDLAGEAEFQRRRILAGGEQAATRAENQALVRRAQGRNARRGSFLRAGSSLLTGAGAFGGSGGSRAPITTSVSGRFV